MKFLKYVFESVSRSAAVMFAVVFIAIGVPLWWKTTEVYRVSLPYDEIQALKELKVTQRLDVNVVFPDSVASTENLQNVLDSLSYDASDNKLPFHYNWSVRKMFAEEIIVLKNAGDIIELDAGLNKLNIVNDPGMVWLFVVDNEKFLTSMSSHYHIGQHRNIFLKHNKDQQAFGEVCFNIVKNVLIKEGVLHKAYSSLRDGTSKQHLPDKDQMRSVHATPAYDVTFTLIQPGPHVTWEIEDAIENYLKPFVDKLSLFADFNIKSQIFYLTKLNVNPKLDSEKGHHILYPDQLPHVINPVEELLGSHVSVNPNLNFLVYIPPKQQMPLLIYDDDGMPSTTNAFLSPRWGGFLFYNLKDANDTLDMAHVMSVFITQLRKLIGLPDLPLEGSIDSTGCSDWEMDFLLRKRTLENIAISVGSLNSLAQLLEGIRNIVINDDVGLQVYESVSSVKLSIDHLHRGNLKTAFIESKKAFIASEKAFFDPSMLKLLYFPDDQKYAIYIPLFLPVSIPILTSIISLVKSYKMEKSKTD